MNTHLHAHMYEEAHACEHAGTRMLFHTYMHTLFHALPCAIMRTHIRACTHSGALHTGALIHTMAHGHPCLRICACTASPD